MTERVTVSVKDGVAKVSLARPEKLNALDRAMFQALVDAGLRIRADNSEGSWAKNN